MAVWDEIIEAIRVKNREKYGPMMVAMQPAERAEFTRYYNDLKTLIKMREAHEAAAHGGTVEKARLEVIASLKRQAELEAGIRKNEMLLAENQAAIRECDRQIEIGKREKQLMFGLPSRTPSSSPSSSAENSKSSKFNDSPPSKRAGARKKPGGCTIM